jgi:hypothetical protein
MNQIPTFLIGQNYFHHTDEFRPPTMISSERLSIWNSPNPMRSNGSHIVVTHNGQDVFLFIHCGICKQWRMPSEGGHTRSHHQAFLDGGICLPVGHTSWMVYFKINRHYNPDFQPADVYWNPNLPGLIEIPQAPDNPMAIRENAMGEMVVMEEEDGEIAAMEAENDEIEIESENNDDDDDDDEDEIVNRRRPGGGDGRRRNQFIVREDDESSIEENPPPQAIRQAIHRGVDENIIVHRSNTRPSRATAGQIDKFTFSPPRVSKRHRNDAFGDATNRT